MRTRMRMSCLHLRSVESGWGKKLVGWRGGGVRSWWGGEGVGLGLRWERR